VDNCNFNFADKKILVVGDIMLDVYFMGDVARVSPEAPVPIVMVKKKSTTLGGAGNVALNLVKLGCRTFLFGVRGEDRAGQRLLQLVNNNGIHDCLKADRGYITTSKTRVIAQGQQLIRLDEEEAWKDSHVDGKELMEQFEEKLNEANAVILSDYGKGVFQHIEPVQLIKKCKQRQIPVFVDSKAGNWERFRGATCITPNIREVEDVVGFTVDDDEQILKKIAQSLRKRFDFSWFVITRGAEGMLLAGPEKNCLFVKATAHEVYDVSGAGDTVIATLSAGISSGLIFPSAVELANIAAGIVVEKLGSQPVSKAELETAYLMNTYGANDACIGKTAFLDVARLQVKAWQAFGDKVVFTNGCFDLIHAGHVHALQEAKNAGTRLVVGINSDVSVKRLKGNRRPIIPERDRIKVLSSLGCVDLIVPFEEDTPLDVIDKLKPQVLVKGGDYALEDVVGRELVESYGGKVLLVPFLEGYSTVAIEREIQRKSITE